MLALSWLYVGYVGLMLAYAGSSWPKLVSSWPKLVSSWPKLAQLGLKLPKVGSTLAPSWLQPGLKLACSKAREEKEIMDTYVEKDLPAAALLEITATGRGQ